MHQLRTRSETCTSDQLSGFIQPQPDSLPLPPRTEYHVRLLSKRIKRSSTVVVGVVVDTPSCVADTAGGLEVANCTNDADRARGGICDITVRNEQAFSVSNFRVTFSIFEPELVAALTGSWGWGLIGMSGMT
eukprot:SAG31_NODE_2615_length_5371_cov_89.477238_4_plen_132_part_00